MQNFIFKTTQKLPTRTVKGAPVLYATNTTFLQNKTDFTTLIATCR